MQDVVAALMIALAVGGVGFVVRLVWRAEREARARGLEVTMSTGGGELGLEADRE